MPRTQKQIVVDRIVEFYLESGDFNGISFGRLLDDTCLSEVALRRALSALIKEEKISAVFGAVHPNSHIRALPDVSIEHQLSALEPAKIDSYHTCLYPLPKHLADVVSRDLYADEPFTRMLALGEPQLAFKAFDLSVLEYYRNDPRYHYDTDDISGRLVISTEFYESDQTRESDKVLLDTFGFCYDEEMNRGVAVYLRYLRGLSPEHQQVWRAKLLTGSYRLHPEYYRYTIIGDWGTKIPIFRAFTSELRIINQMCDAMGRPRLFRNDFQTSVPREFSFLVRPTLKEFNSFVHTLDKMISDNIDKKFFQNEVPDETETTRKDGKIVVQQRGTLKMLEQWIREQFRTDDWTEIDAALATMNEVRRLRQNPAHRVDENVFDQKYIHEQRALVSRAYDAVRLLRLIFANHPRVKAAGIEVEHHLAEGLICSY